MSEGPTVAILLVCRNRRDKTVAAMRRVRAQTLTIPYQFILFDDASTDGTVEAALAEAPETIVIHGDGNAFWNGGLYRCWQRALDFPFKAFLWLNDDVALDLDAFQRLADAWSIMHTRESFDRFLLVGSTRGDDGAVTYGGMRHVPTPVAFRLKKVQPDNTLKPVDTFNGNIVLVPRDVVDRIGINDPAFYHNLGDIDYGLRARSADIPIMLVPGTLGYCDANHAKSQDGFGSPSLSLRGQWRKVNTHHGLPFRSWWHFTQRHSGRWVLLHYLLPYRRLFLPGRGKR